MITILLYLCHYLLCIFISYPSVVFPIPVMRLLKLRTKNPSATASTIWEIPAIPEMEASAPPCRHYAQNLYNPTDYKHYF